MICLTDPNTEKGNQSLTTQIITEMEKNLMTNQAEITSGIFARKMKIPQKGNLCYFDNERKVYNWINSLGHSISINLISIFVN